MRTRLLVALVLGAALAGTMPIGRAGPRVPWVPDSVGLVPLATVDAAGKVGFIHPTRRIVPHATVPGRVLLGHALFGLYQSASGGGWTTLTPNCLNLVRPPLIEDLAGLLSGCGVEGIATDPLNPLSLYVSTYNIDILAPGIPVTPGGVFRSEISAAGISSGVGTGGLTWRKVLPGVRGNALALRRTSLTTDPTIVAGRIQRSTNDVGTDDNSFCRNVARPDNCSPSVYVSTTGGRTWTPKYFEPAPCANEQSDVSTSSRIVGNLAFDPVHDNVVYAGANSGLWFSSDGGGSWSLALEKCGTNPGFAVTQRGSARRIYLGTFESKLYAGATGASGPSGLAQLTLLGDRLEGQILSVLLDAADPDERTLFVAAWTQPPTGGGGAGGVFKVRDLGNGFADVERLGDGLLDFARPLVKDLPQPYPLIQDPQWRPSLFIAQHPLAPDLLWVSTVLGGVWVRVDE